MPVREAFCVSRITQNHSNTMKKLIMFLALVSLAPQAVLAHPGGLDAIDCHTCRTNCEEKYEIPSGWYHCHAGGDKNVYTPTPGEETSTPEEPEPELEPAPEPSPTPEPEPIVVVEEEATPPPAPEHETTEVVDDAPVRSSQNEREGVQNESEAVETDMEIEGDTGPHTPSSDTSADVEVEEESSPPTAGDYLITLAVLGGLGYGGYRGVKAITQRLKT